MFFFRTRTLWIANKSVSQVAYAQGERDLTLPNRVLSAPRPKDLTFDQLATVYRRRSVKNAALMILLHRAGEWSGLAAAADGDASSYLFLGDLAEKAALNLAKRVLGLPEMVVRAKVAETVGKFQQEVVRDIEHDRLYDGMSDEEILSRPWPPG